MDKVQEKRMGISSLKSWKGVNPIYSKVGQVLEILNYRIKKQYHPKS